MPLFLITSVCNEGVSATSFKVVEAESRLSIAQHILDRPYDWERFLRRTKLWWDLTYYPYKYGEPRGWSAADLLTQIDATHVDGDSDYQFRIHEIRAIERLPGERAAGDGESSSSPGEGSARRFHVQHGVLRGDNVRTRAGDLSITGGPMAAP